MGEVIWGHGLKTQIVKAASGKKQKSGNKWEMAWNGHIPHALQMGRSVVRVAHQPVPMRVEGNVRRWGGGLQHQHCSSAVGRFFNLTSKIRLDSG
jgi:hypothetical protein